MQVAGRLVGIDFGLKRIGVALSDPRQVIATPFLVIELSGSLVKTAIALKGKLAAYKDLGGIVVGLPLHLSGEESELSLLARKFAAALEEQFSLPLIFWDERLTSAQVEKSLKETSCTRKKRAQLSDTLAAALILQNYLDFQQSGLPPLPPFPQ